MQARELPPDVQTLVCEHIESYEQLELLLIIRAEKESTWTEETLTTRLRIPVSLVRAALDGLESAGFVEVQGQGSEQRYLYLRQNDEVEATISSLTLAYRDNPIPIIKLMSANAIERLRTAALRTFADAFVLKKDKNRG